MRIHPWILLAALTASACSDDMIGPEPAEFAELCGEVGPVQILALDPDRPLAHVFDQGRVGERRVFEVGYLDEEESTLPLPSSKAEELWSVGLCGEDPLKIAEGDSSLRTIHYLDSWSDTLFACDWQLGQILAIDPTGTRPTNVVFEAHECDVWPTDDGLLTFLPHDEETGALVLQPWPEDPWTMKAEQVVVLDPVRIRMAFGSSNERDVLGVTEDDYFAVTTNDELVAISRVDGETTTVATDVLTFRTDRTGRHVLWQSLEVVNDDTEFPEGPISLIDRQTGEETLLIEGKLQQMPDPFVLESMDILVLNSNFGTSDRFYRLPTLEAFEMPTDISIFRAIDETRVLIGDTWFRGPYRLFDTVTLELTELYDGDGSVRPDDDGLLVLDGVKCCIDENSTRKAGRLVRIPFDGQAELLARRATLFYRVTTDNRILTTVDIGTDLVGSLIVIDPETLDEYLVADRVSNFGVSNVMTEIDGDPIVTYTVIDPERQGVWQTRLAN